MSLNLHFLTSIVNFLKKIGGGGANTDWTQVAENDLNLAAPGLETIVALTADEEDAAEVVKVVTEVQSDLGTLSSLVAQAHSESVQPGAVPVTTLVKIIAVLDSVKSNIGGILTAGHIKNEATVAKVTAIVNGVVGEVEAILAIVPQK